MGKQVSNAKRLEKSHQRVDKLFNWAVNEKYAVAAKKSHGLSKTSYAGYQEKLHTLVNKYAERYGVYELVKFQADKMMQLIKEEYPNPSTQKAYTNAADFFSRASSESDVFKAPVVMIHKGQMEEYWQNHKIVRRAKDSTVLKASHKDCEAVIEQLKESNSPYRSQAILAIELGRRIGSRIEGALSLRGRDIVLHKDGTATVHLREKGNLDRWVPITNPADVQFLQNLKTGLKNCDHTVMPPLHYRSGGKSGKIMSQDKAAERLAKVVQPAAIRAGLSNPSNRDDPAFSIHSSRKTFCQTRVDYYANQTKRELKEELERRVVEQEKWAEDLKKEKGEHYSITSYREKYKTAIDRVNWAYRNGERVRRTKTDRDLNHKELSFLLASFDSGHFRTDILRYYATYYPPTAPSPKMSGNC